jgi:pantothenate kinase
MPHAPSPLTDLRPSLSELLGRARSLADEAHETRSRRVLGITGPPGAGKSTLAAAIVEGMGADAACLPMDGYHLAQAELVRLGRADRKGAPDTFDGVGFVALLRRLRDSHGDVVYAPAFERAIEEPIAGAIPIPPDVPLVVAEGNYLLLDDSPWGDVRRLLDVAWFLEPDPDVRVARLIDRHVRFGRTPDEARAWVLRSDEANARLIEPTKARADLVIRTSSDL